MTATIGQTNRETGTKAADLALRAMPRLNRWAAVRLEADPLDHGLSLRQLVTLLLLREGPVAAGALARRMKVTPAVVTGIADRLERRGYVRREADPVDRRRLHLALTERGLAVSGDLVAVLVGDLAARFAELPPDDLDRLAQGLEVLDRVVATLDAEPRPHPGNPCDDDQTGAETAPAGTKGPEETRMTDTDVSACPVHAASSDRPVHPISFAGHESRADAYDRYAEYREEGPVVRVKFEGVGPDESEMTEEQRRAQAASPFVRELWMVTTFDEGNAALLDERFSVDPRSVMTPEQRAAADQVPQELRPISRSMLTVDPPDHTRLRKLVQPSFTGRLMDSMKPRIRAIAEGLLDRAEAAAEARGEEPGNRKIELVSQFAYPLPVTVISDMLGIPVEDRERARVWSENLIRGRFQQGDEEARASLLDFIDYLKELFERKRQQPGDDMISELVVAEAEGDKLDEEELLSMVFILYIAGHITTVNLIGNGVYALLTHPTELAKVVADPAGTAKGVVEETLRFHGPAEGIVPRVATEDVTIGDVTIERGERMMVNLASADRDPSKFANPDQYDISRPDANRHIAFGKGLHVCLGAPLARVEGQIAFQVLFERYPHMRLAVAPEEIRWNDGFLRGLQAVPILV